MKRKIGIITTKTNELTSENVIDWLRYYKMDVTRINAEDFDSDDFQFILNNDEKFQNQHKALSFDIIWLRRWKEREFYQDFLDRMKDTFDGEILFKLTYSIKRDYEILTKALIKSFNSKSFLSNTDQLNVNKLEVLMNAVNIGLKIPDTMVTGNKKKLEQFYTKQKNGVITKDLDSPFYMHRKNFTHAIFVNPILELDNVPDKFPVSLFQERIEKKFEIRSFILEYNIYSMAIFSQSDNQTQEDFRRYNHHKPNRTVPYKLPLKIEEKLLKLMTVMKLVTASIDLIVDKNDNYIFLEINPVGQFGMISQPCNYRLEKKIAEYLINKK
jgi:ATP-GRASP peptide maturase of grasp-with-spasm system